MSTALTRILRTLAGLAHQEEAQSIFALTSGPRVTPALIEFHKQRAFELRAEYYRNMWRAVWASLMRTGRR